MMYSKAWNELDKPDKLNEIIDDYWQIFTDYNQYHKNNNEKIRIVVNGSIPIMWFGNLKAYQKKEREWKIVTVGMNPSFLEFPDGDLFCRFLDAEGADKINRKLKPEEINNLIKSYNAYFRKDPYPDFFRAFERVLQSLPLPNDEVASYGEGDDMPRNLYDYKKPNKKHKYIKAQYTAVHIDYQTALATNPTWSKLKAKKYNDEKERVLAHHLYEKLLDYLAPNVVLFSDPDLKDVIENRSGNRLFEEFLPTEQRGFDRISYIYKNRLYIYGTFGNRPFDIPDEKKDNGNGKRLEKDFLKQSFDEYLKRLQK